MLYAALRAQGQIGAAGRATGFRRGCLAVGGVQVLSEPRHTLPGGTAAQYARLGYGEQLYLVLVLAGFRRRHGGDGRRSSA